MGERTVARINENGYLELLRAERWKKQNCPWKTEPVFCGDWCPLFETPDVKGTTIEPHVYICCAGRIVNYDPVTDLRGASK